MESTATLCDLLEQGQEQLARLRANEEAQEAVRLGAVRAEWAAKWEALDQGVMAAVPPALLPYIIPGERGNVQDGYIYPDDPRIQVEAWVPGCLPIAVSLIHSGGTYVLSKEPPAYSVPGAYLDTDYDDTGLTYRVITSWRRDYAYATNHLPLALALAAERGAARPELEHEADERNAASAVRAATRQRDIEAQRAAKQADEERLLAALVKDPVALALARVFVAVQAERDRWQEQLDQAGDWLETTEASAQRRANDLQQEIERTRREADDYRYRLAEAEYQAKRQR